LRVLAPYDPLLVNELTSTLLEAVTPEGELRGEVLVAEPAHA
jgi:hypothetical protein